MNLSRLEEKNYNGSAEARGGQRSSKDDLVWRPQKRLWLDQAVAVTGYVAAVWLETRAASPEL